MIGRWLFRLRSFLVDRRGNFAIPAALLSVPLLGAMGGAVDFSMFYLNQIKIQDAADAAALAAAKQFPYESDAGQLNALANAFFKANAGSLYRADATLHYDGTTWNADNSRELKLHVDYTYDPLFLWFLSSSFAGQASTGLSAEVKSAVAIGDTTVEVAFVLDTSGSMNDSPSAGGPPKISTLRTVAEGAVDKLFSSAAGVATNNPVRVSVVPFSGAVNVGTGNATASWMDTQGRSPIHHENFDWTTYTDANGGALAKFISADGTWRLASDTSVYLTRQYIFKNMKWATKTYDKTSCRWGSTTYSSCTWTQSSNYGWMLYAKVGRSSSYVCYQSSDATCQPPYTVTYASSPAYSWGGCVEARPGGLDLTDDAPTATNPATLFVPWFAPDEPDSNNQSFSNSYTQDIGGSTFLAQQKGMNKYLLVPVKDHTQAADDHRYSPNYACTPNPILPLTADKDKVKSMIAGLDALDATNVPAGIVWGWRTLSPGAPFTEGRATGEAKNVKAMIVMTDGSNTYYTQSNDNKSRFGAYGFSVSDRIFDGSGQSKTQTSTGFTTAMDAKTRKVCENAKNDGRIPLKASSGNQLTDPWKGGVTRDGVVIYTIAFDVPMADQSRVNQLLTDCASYTIEDLRNTALPYASKGKHFYKASDAAELDEVFAEIMASMSNLRISN